MRAGRTTPRRTPDPRRRTLSDRVRDFGARVTQGQPWRTVPNFITLTRIGLLPVLLILLSSGHFTAALVFGVVVFASDFVDGYIARRTNTVTPLGTWLDPVADRLAGVTVSIGLGAGQAIPFEYVWLLLIPDVVLGTISVVAFRGTPPVTVTRVGKVRTALIFAGLTVVLAGMSATEWRIGDLAALIAGAPPISLVGVGFCIALVGIVLHYVAAVQYAWAMLVRWGTGRPAERRRPS